MARDWTRARRITLEFTVIAVGVFTALFADEWRQSQRDLAEQREYAERLIVDVRANIESMEDLATRFANSTPALVRLMTVARLDAPGVVEQVASDLEATRGWSWGDFPADRTVFDELVSTGRLALIRDAAVRDLLSSYYTVLIGQQRGIERRRAVAGIGHVAIGAMPLSESALAAAQTAIPGGSFDGHSLLGDLDVGALRSAAAAELNIRTAARGFIANSNERGRRLIALLEQVR